MELIEEESYPANGRNYQIQTLWGDCGWEIIIRDEKSRQVGPVYSVTLETEQDARAYKYESALALLKRIAKNDLDEGHIKAKPEAA